MPKLQGKQILIIDDEETLREVLFDEFELLGASCEMAADGEEALKLADAKNFDVILCDIRMAPMSGLVFLENLKSQMKEDIPPVILLSGYPDLSPEAAKELGAYDLLKKPWDMEHLTDLIMKAV